VARILIVDDEPQFRRVLRIALGTRGYDVREAASGADALAILRSDPAQLVLVDWQMPGLDGLQTCRAIRAWSDVPIIMVTSRDQKGRDQALAAGADDYVTKPFKLDELMAHVESALSR
jgi:two-component system KDP operon response regulator KdpE